MRKIKTLTALLAGAMLLISATACGSAPSAADLTSGITKTSANQGNIGEVTLEKGDKYAVITIEGYGSITCKLFPEVAPVGVENFIELAESGYYNGLKVHRVISGFMFQGGSKSGTGSVDPDIKSFAVEANENMRHFYGALCYGSAMNSNGGQFYIVNANRPVDYEAYADSTKTTLDANVEYIESVIMPQVEEGSDYYRYYKAMGDQMKSQSEFIDAATDEIKAKYAEVGGTPSLDGGYTVFGQTVDGWDVIDAVSSVQVKDNGSGEESAPVDKIIIESVEIKTVE